MIEFDQLSLKARDNTIICLNLINKMILIKNYGAKTKERRFAFIKIYNLAKENKISYLEASEMLKKQLKGELYGK